MRSVPHHAQERPSAKTCAHGKAIEMRDDVGNQDFHGTSGVNFERMSNRLQVRFLATVVDGSR